MNTRRGAIYRAQIAALEFIGRDKSRPYVILTPYVVGPPREGNSLSLIGGKICKKKVVFKLISCKS